jgi:hypothetical protein
MNPELDLTVYNLEREISEVDKEFFSALGIRYPLPLQELCYNFCTATNFSGRWVVQLETGSGKTALCFTVACNYFNKGYRVVIVNNSAELTFRDFMKAERAAKELKIDIHFVRDSMMGESLRKGITFMPF